MRHKERIGLFAWIIVPVLVLMILNVPLVFGQQTCQSGTYNLNGNIKVTGNIEATGTIQGTNVKATSGAQTSCVLMGTTTNPSTGGTCWSISRDSKTVAIPSCVQSGHCMFVIKTLGGPRIGFVGVEGVSEFFTFPGLSNYWIASDILPSIHPYGGPSLSPILTRGMFDGKLWPHESFPEAIMTAGIGLNKCTIMDDPGGSSANFQLSGEGCISSQTCEYWACP